MMIVPPFLKSGSQIAVLSTALKVLPEELQAGIQWIEEQGWVPVIRQALFSEWFRFAGTDEIRFQELQRAFDDPGIDAIWFARGGYGTLPLLWRLNWEHFLQRPKWLIGFSDLTALLLEAVAHQVVSLHAPVLISFPQLPLSVKNSIRDLLTGNWHTVNYPVHSTQTGKLSGMIWGGNLSLVANAVGRIYPPESMIFFLEDVDEYFYHIDRMCWQLVYAGYFQNTKALISGSFTQLKDNEIPFGKSLQEIFLEKLPNHCPLVLDFPFGHQPENYPLLLGATACVEILPHQISICWQKSN